MFGASDSGVLFVMAGAVGVYGLGMLVLRGFESVLKLPLAAPSPIDRRLVIGPQFLAWLGIGGSVVRPTAKVRAGARCSLCGAVIAVRKPPRHPLKEICQSKGHNVCVAPRLNFLRKR
jgi:hypothetical protein